MNTTTKQYVAWSLRIIIAFLFIISAIAKLYPSPYFAISTFEVKQLYPMGFSEVSAAYFSRILIGIEFALGVLLLQNHFLRRLVVPATFLMLVVFTTHLSIETFVSGGDSGNCGCFGTLLPMTPIEAIIKNVVAMALLGYLFYLLPKIERKGNIWILISGTLAFILLIFMLAPMQPPTTEEAVILETTEEPAMANDPIMVDNDTVKTENVIKTDTVKNVVPKVADAPKKKASGYASYFPTIDNGKKVLCFFVPGCEHCRDAAKELTEMRKKDKNFPEVKIIFMNEEADLIPQFFEFAGAEYPYKIIEIIPFWKVLGNNRDTPGIKYLWNGNEYIYYDGIGDNQFNGPQLQQLINKPFSELKK